jgi:hypothetical protein
MSTTTNKTEEIIAAYMSGVADNSKISSDVKRAIRHAFICGMQKGFGIAKEIYRPEASES